MQNTTKHSSLPDEMVEKGVELLGAEVESEAAAEGAGMLAGALAFIRLLRF